MKELSLNVLDVAENSVKAGAAHISITLNEDDAGLLTLTIADDGCGMNAETLSRVTDPFYTTRTTRKVGLGLPLLKLASEQTGGKTEIESQPGKGTTVRATFDTASIDFTPLGDMTSTLTTLIMGSPNIDFEYGHTTPRGRVALSTAELRGELGEVPLDNPEVIAWIRDFLNEQYNNLEEK